MRLAPKLKRMEHVELIGEYPRLPGGRWVRFLVGRPMDNMIRTNATFFHDATRGYPSRWLRLAGWKRSAARIISVYGLALTSFSAFSWRMGAHSFVLHLILWNLLLLTPLYLILLRRLIRNRGFSVWVFREMDEDQELQEEQRFTESGALEPQPIPKSKRSWQRKTIIIGRRQWEKDVVIPLARAVAPLLQLERRPEEARTWVTVPHNYHEPKGDPVEILLPATFAGVDDKGRLRVEKAVASRLQMLEWSASWQLHGEHPRLLLSAPPAPPKVALFGEFRRLLETTQEYRPYLGVVSSGELLAAEMVSDSPHIALSAGSGAGKSMMMKAIIMQALRWGWAVVILDWKAESHTWAKGLPGVRYVTTVEDLHDVGVQVGDEVDSRKEMAGTEYPKTLVVREEWNMTATLLMEYWLAMRSMATPEEKRQMPVRSPALVGFQKLDFAGRQFGMFDLLAAQRMSARVFNGNADARENFMIRLLARYTMQTWKMLVPDIKFIRRPKEVGRWVVAAGDEATIVQGVLTTDDEAREFAMGGIANPASPWAVHRPAQRGHVDRTQGNELPGQVAAGISDSSIIDGEEVDIRTMKLAELADILEPFGITLKILRLAAGSDQNGDPSFPKPHGGDQFRGYTYDVEAVKIWTRRRHASQIAAKEAK